MWLYGMLLAALISAPSLAARADEHIYSYDAETDPARALTATGLSFDFERHGFGGVRILRIIQTGDQGSADLKRGSERDLGPGGLKAALGSERAAGGLYEIRSEGDGQAFVDAVCPGAKRAWLVIGGLKRFRDLTVQSVGLNEGAATAHHCATMQFSFYSEWTLPPDRAPPRARFQRSGP